MPEPALCEEVLVVEGLHCGSCAAAVEARLKRQPGVIEAAVNFAADSAMLQWDSRQTSLPRLQQAVARLGYQLRDPDDIESSARNSDQTRKHLQWRLAVALVFGMWSMMPALLVYLAPLGIVEASVVRPLAIASGLFALPVIGYSGSHFYRVGWRTLRVGVPGLDTLISVAVAAACLVSVWRLATGHVDVYFDAAVMLITFQLVARLIDGSVRRRAADVVRGYLRQAPETVTLINDDGTLQTRPAADIGIAQRIRLTAGQALALDGQVISGSGLVDMSMLSGEHQPQHMEAGSELLAGCQLIDGELELKVTAGVGQRRIDSLARSVRGLLSRKTALQRLTDQLARLLLPIIVVAAGICVAVALGQGLTTAQAVIRGLAVLIIACPCALSLAIPLVVVLGHTRMVESGVIFRDPAALETAANTHVVIFDKTGTLTTDTPSVAAIVPHQGHRQAELLQLAIDTLDGTSHPIAKGLAEAGTASANAALGERHSFPGRGTQWQHGGTCVLAGHGDWLRDQGIEVPALDDGGMVVHLACNSRYLGHLRFEESLRAEAIPTVQRLQQAGQIIYLLSGDTRASCLTQAQRLGIPADRVVAGVTPEGKHRFVETLERHHGVAFVGDGMNDGLALAAAKLGIAIDTASATARAAAAVYLPDGLGGVPDTLHMARRARRLMRQNLAWALGYNALALPLAMAGWVQPVIAAIAMTLSSLCVLLNSLRMRAATRRHTAGPVNQPPRREQPGQAPQQS